MTEVIINSYACLTPGFTCARYLSQKVVDVYVKYAYLKIIGSQNTTIKTFLAQQAVVSHHIDCTSHLVLYFLYYLFELCSNKSNVSDTFNTSDIMKFTYSMNERKEEESKVVTTDSQTRVSD